MKTLLVTGASGFLGWNVCQAAQAAGWQVWGTSGRKSVTIPGVKVITLDLKDASACHQLFQDVQPDAVIHLAAQSSPNICQTAPAEAYAINVTVSCHIAELCGDRQIPCVFSSTDLVFDGQHPPYRETDPVCPVNHYGEQKVQAEIEMRSRYPNTAICRMPLMFGYAPYASSFIQPFLKILRSGESLSLFTDEIRTPVSGQSAAQGLLLALEQVQGCVHLGGKERLSRYEFGRLMVKIFGLDESNLRACRQADVPMAAPRPSDVSLDSTLAFRLGYQPGLIQDELEALRDII
jgi:dTDP-4-dehydrorhamnose reductase